ncbi:MAG: hypothetical protein MJE77_13920, partial [Proteobacteria bacterium]|nr:hypothetical protein [Pseudomonadota bacterium]
MFSHKPPGKGSSHRGYAGRSHRDSSGDWDHQDRQLAPKQELRELAEKDLDAAFNLARVRGVDLYSTLVSMGVDTDALKQRQAAKVAARNEKEQARRADESAKKATEVCARLGQATQIAERARATLREDQRAHPRFYLCRGAEDITRALGKLHDVASFAAENEAMQSDVFAGASRLVRSTKAFLNYACFERGFRDRLLGMLVERLNAFMKAMDAVGWDEEFALASASRDESLPDHSRYASTHSLPASPVSDGQAPVQLSTRWPRRKRETEQKGARAYSERAEVQRGSTVATEPNAKTEKEKAEDRKTASARKLSDSKVASSQQENQQAIELATLVRSTLLPAYRGAVDALDPMAAMELAWHIIGGLQLMARIRRDGQLPPGQTAGKDAAAQSAGMLERDLVGELVVQLGRQMGPQLFQGEPVLGSVVEPDMGPDPIAYLADEAGTVVELLSMVAIIRERTGASEGICSPLSADNRREIADLIAPWRSRPVNLAFLIRALSEDGIWQAIHDAHTGSGQRLADIEAASAWQAFDTGALADVGELDSATVARLVGVRDAALLDNGDHGASDSAELDDTTAMELFDKLRDASPAARGPIIRQIEGMGKLGAVCEHLPWRHVQAMHDAI